MSWKSEEKQKGLTENNVFEKEPAIMLGGKLVKYSSLGPGYVGTHNPCQEIYVFFVLVKDFEKTV